MSARACFRIVKARLLAAVVLFACCTQAAWAVDRQAFTFTHYDLHVVLDPAKQGMEVRGKVTVRNDSNVAQRQVVLQISSTLAWQSITVGGNALQWLGQEYTSDIDHAGSLSEAIVTLPEPIAPRATATLDLEYGGAVPRVSTRLTRIGTPEELATRSDWDQIGETFTAVRSVGYVTWFPVSMDAVSLSDGTAVFDALAAWKHRHGSTVLEVAIAPRPGVSVASNADAVADGQAGATKLTFRGLAAHVPTFVIAAFQSLERPAVSISHLAEHTSLARDYAVAAEKQAPAIIDWFGPQREKLRIIELPDLTTAPFDTGAFLFTPLRQMDPAGLQLTVAHQLVHTSFVSNRSWIQEGTAHLMQVVTREQQAGRAESLRYLDQFQPQLVQVEKAALAPADAANQGQMQPQPLASTNDELFYRSKAAFVWVMLRDLVGDDALKRAFAAYRADQDLQPGYVQSLLEAPALAGQPKRDLEWFFDDWVYRDKGLPDFRIESAYARATLLKTYTVTVTVENIGTATAEVPVLVRGKGGERMARVRVPAKGRGVVRIPFPQEPIEVVVNDGSVPEMNVDNNTFKIQTSAPSQ
ncbi:MAG TPA: hypothetical protein VN622_16685 [Clostridia bacterium]|nr:hypothetical protein [Clostridia bacterium]